MVQKVMNTNKIEKMNAMELLLLFSSLIKTGEAWDCTGDYSRMARCLMDEWYIDEKGNVLYEFTKIKTK